MSRSAASVGTACLVLATALMLQAPAQAVAAPPAVARLVDTPRAGATQTDARLPAVRPASTSAAVAKKPVPVAATQPGTDWPSFLGPTGDGKSTETRILKSWPAGGPPLLWHMATGEGYAAPSVADGRLFLFDRHGDTVRLTCVNPLTGDEVWRSEYTTDYEDMYGYSDGPRAVPVIDGDRVYTFGAGGRLRCHRTTDGSLLWDVDTSKTFGVLQNFFGAVSTPVVEGELLIAAVGGSPPESPAPETGDTVGNGSAIVAFDKRTGKVRYKISDELASSSSPLLTTIGDRRWGFLFARGGLVAFEPASGKIDFHFPFRARMLESVNASNPVVVEDTVFITESYGAGSALLRVRPGGYEVIRQDASRRGQTMSCHFMTPVHLDGYLYGSSGQGSGEAQLRAINLLTGEIKWSERGLGRATLIYADGHLIVFTEWGRLLLVKATPERYAVVADATPLLAAAATEHAVTERTTGESRTDEASGGTGITTHAPAVSDRAMFRYPSWSPPVLSHGLLYLRGKGRLACFDLTTSAPAPAAVAASR